MIIDHSGIIRDMLFARVVTLPYFEGFVARRCIQLPIQPMHLPYLGVYVVDETMLSDGDANHGHIAFIHDLKLGISVQLADNDPVVLERKLNEAFWEIMEGLWPDQYLMNLLDTYNPTTGTRNPNNMRIEAVMRGHRRNNWGTINNETPWAEMQYEPVLRYRSYFAPGPFDDLERIDTQVVPLKKRPSSLPSADEVQRVILRYEFGPDGAKPLPYKDEETIDG